MRVSSPSIALIWFVAPISIGAALGAAACAPPQDDFDGTNSNVQASTPVPTTVVPAASPATMSPPVAPSTVPVVVPTTNTAAAATSAAPPVVTPSATPPAVSTPETTPSTAATMKPAGGVGNDLIGDDEFWIPLTSNGVGVVGSWYEYMDEAGSTAVKTIDETGTVCITGTTVIQVDPATDWGAGIGLNLNDEDIWDGTMYGGFSFSATFTSDAPVTLEVKMDGIDTPHEVTVKSGANTVKWTNVAQPTWVTDTTAFDESKLVALQFKVATVTEAANAYSLCIASLKVLD